MQRKINEAEEIDFLISKNLNGSANQEEIEKLSVWIKNYKNETYFEQYKKVWHVAHDIPADDNQIKESLQGFLEYTRARERTQNIRTRIIYVVSSAAAMLLFFWGYSLFVQNDISTISFSELKYNTDSIKIELSDGRIINPLRKTPEINLNPANHREISYTSQKTGSTQKSEVLKYNSVSIPSGERFAIVLSDGTKVYLNSNSYIRYPVRFGKDSRTVTLMGRAYFDVTKSDIPFIVHTPDMKVEVLGTSFDVESNKNAMNSSVILVEGSVKVYSDGQSKTISPNEKYSINRLDREVSVSSVDSRTMTLWKNGILVLSELSFDTMLDNLRSWYGVEIINESSVSKKEKFYGKFDRENIEEAMKTIALSAKVKYRINNGTLIVEDAK
ncbi:MAG: FecR family protein [Bacteroidales bacterium]|jgi:ferric-dicitrate binding protein FerR (iron transport regulator)